MVSAALSATLAMEFASTPAIRPSMRTCPNVAPVLTLTKKLNSFGVPPPAIIAGLFKFGIIWYSPVTSLEVLIDQKFSVSNVTFALACPWLTTRIETLIPVLPWETSLSNEVTFVILSCGGVCTAHCHFETANVSFTATEPMSPEIQPSSVTVSVLAVERTDEVKVKVLVLPPGIVVTPSVRTILGKSELRFSNSGAGPRKIRPAEIFEIVLDPKF